MRPNGSSFWRPLFASRITSPVTWKSQHQLPLSRRVHNFCRTQFSITSKDPHRTKPGGVFDIIDKIKATASIEASPNPGLVLFTTPAFSTWLEDTSFMRNILDRLFNQSGTKAEPTPVDALLGVVDGIPSSPGTGPTPTEPSAEGFAIMTGDRNVMLPALWDVKSLSSPINQDRRASISFHADTGRETFVEAGISLANTIFRNGRTSTLLASTWQNLDGAEGFERLNQAEKQFQTIVYPQTNLSKVSLSCSLTPLTPPRRIASGLGNIARRLYLGGEKPSPASQELETVINAYFDAVDVPKQPITVWALVIPEEVMAAPDSVIRDALIVSPDHIRAFWTNRTSTNTYVWDFVRRGAGLHRVLSGGGGWGMKQGLLSLDPEIALPKPDESQDNIGTFNPMDSRSQTEALGDIARPGSYIQFFVAQEPAERSSSLLSKLLKHDKEEENGPSTETSLVIGSIPSRVDDMPLQVSSSETPLEGQQKNRTIEFKNSHFGVQSESGMFLKLSGTEESSIKTKIDVPYSTLSLLGGS